MLVKSGDRGSRSRLLLTTTIVGNSALCSVRRISVVLSEIMGTEYFSDRAVPAATRITSANPRSVRNSALSAGPPNGPDFPLYVARPFLEEIMFSMVHGDPEGWLLRSAI